MRTTLLRIFVLFWMGNAITVAQVNDDTIQVHLNAKEFQLALRVAETNGANRNQVLKRIALAQASSGDAAGSKDTLRRIADAGAFGAATGAVRRSAAGGGTGADFDSLINLITTTVAPNSWDDVGGPGSIVEFPGGVYVDSVGVLRKAIPATQQIQNELNLVRASIQLAEHDPRRPSELRMVSLPRLQRELQVRAAFGEAATETMKHLAGLREVRYLFLFPETDDCVIAGPAGDWEHDEDGLALTDKAPVLLLDDLITLLKNAAGFDGRFGCSITPKKENLSATKQFLAMPTGPLKPNQTARWVEEIRSILGLQNIEVFGVNPGSHVARVMVEADYHMKLVGMGLEPSVPGVPSYLDSIEADAIPQSLDVLRWWFTLRNDAIRKNKTGDAFALAAPLVQLRCENEELSDGGDRVHTGVSSELNQLFATRFTKHYRRLAKQYPVYAQLESLFELSVVAALIQSDEVQSHIDWQPDWLISALSTALGEAPREVPSIVNHRTINRRHVVVGVSGGITVNAFDAVRRPRIARNGGADWKSNQNAAKPRMPLHSPRWWWD